MLAIALPQIYYSTIAYNRLMSVDMPFADPHRGAPFGDRRGPVIAIAGAFSAISAGAALGGFLGGVLIAGGIFSGLGALTGNKTLATIGGVLSLAGAIGTGFTNATTGEFMNPFADGANFSDTVLGSGFAKIKNFFTPDAIGTSDAVQALGVNGEAVTQNASIDPDSLGASAFTESASQANAGRSSLANVGGNVAPAATRGSSGNGLFSQLLGYKDGLNLISGISDGYMTNQELESLEPLRDAQITNLNANANANNANTQLLKDRYNNLQSQPNVGVGVNENAQVFNQAPGAAAEGKYAIVVNGEVKYVTQAEYDAMRPNPGGGLLRQQGAQS